jgi:hypothetical protein
MFAKLRLACLSLRDVLREVEFPRLPYNSAVYCPAANCVIIDDTMFNV